MEIVEPGNPPLSETSVEAPPASPHIFSFEFKGNALEYFRIWIVNIALSIVTLGIYSAWAKVRTRRYFDNHTFLDGSNFEYHGDPVKILKGRLIIGALLFAYTVGGKISPVITAIAASIFLIMYPWVIVRSMAFNFGNTSFRGLRFGFHGKNMDSYILFLKSLLVVVFSFGIAYPIAVKWMKQFQINNSSYGTSKFKFELKNDESYFWIYLRSGAVVMGFLILAATVAFLSKITFLRGSDPNGGAFIFIFIGVFYSSIIFSSSYIVAAVFNLTVNSVSIEKLNAKSVWSDVALAKVMVGNFFACVFTLGLLFPWAKIRLMRAKLQAMKFEGPENGLTQFNASENQTPGAGADAAADLLDLDFDFGF